MLDNQSVRSSCLVDHETLAWRACYCAGGKPVQSARGEDVDSQSWLVDVCESLCLSVCLSVCVCVVKMLVVVVVVFAFCWLPLYAVNLRIFFGQPLDVSEPEFQLLTQTVIPVAQWVVHIVDDITQPAARRTYTTLQRGCCGSASPPQDHL